MSALPKVPAFNGVAQFAYTYKHKTTIYIHLKKTEYLAFCEPAVQKFLTPVSPSTSLKIDKNMGR